MSSSPFFSKTRTALCLLAMALTTSACSESSSTVHVAADGQAEIKITPPAFLTTRSIVAENLVLLVIVNDEVVEMTTSGEVRTGEIQIAAESAVELKIQWTETIGANSLLLAEAQETLGRIVKDTDFQVIDSSYVTEGDGFDDDDDSFSNLDERRLNTDAFDVESPGGFTRVLGSTQPNIIDGVYTQAFWQNAQFNDWTGQPLLINNLIVDEVGDGVDGDTDYQWGAIHDGEYLSLFIFGKRISVPDVLPTRDSIDFYNDDSIELYWDGDNSRNSFYDLVDDMTFIIPLIRGTDSSSVTTNKSGELDPASEIERGANMEDLVEFDIEAIEFATCLCTGERVTWEIRINLAEAQIPIGEPFSFEIQMNQDDDKDGRDYKWAWAGASRESGDTNEDSDVTWRYPNRMGLMELLPIPGQ